MEHRFVETFVVASWEEHLRQHRERYTATDQDIEERASALSEPAPQTSLPHDRRPARIAGRSGLDGERAGDRLLPVAQHAAVVGREVPEPGVGLGHERGEIVTDRDRRARR